MLWFYAHGGAGNYFLWKAFYLFHFYAYLRYFDNFFDALFSGAK